jgi:hypothetical protein
MQIGFLDLSDLPEQEQIIVNDKKIRNKKQAVFFIAKTS